MLETPKNKSPVSFKLTQKERIIGRSIYQMLSFCICQSSPFPNTSRHSCRSSEHHSHSASRRETVTSDMGKCFWKPPKSSEEKLTCKACKSCGVIKGMQPRISSSFSCRNRSGKSWGSAEFQIESLVAVASRPVFQVLQTPIIELW